LTRGNLQPSDIRHLHVPHDLFQLDGGRRIRALRRNDSRAGAHAEASNETAGEHFTPRDVIELMVDIVLAPESDTLAKPNVVCPVYDPTAGTGGMLSVAEDHIRSANPTPTLLPAFRKLVTALLADGSRRSRRDGVQTVPGVQGQRCRVA